MDQQLTENQIAEKLLEDRTFRKEITTSSHYWFFHTYFNEYVKYPTASFQQEIFDITEDNDIRLAVVTAFRGSGKSTIVTLSFPIWAILGKQNRKFVVILSQTQAQAKMHLQNLKSELEANKLLQGDLGPFEERNEEWSSGSLVIPKYNARITAMSMEQSIRGIRHGSHRPDLIICDDVEDLSSVKTHESRNKTYRWLTGDVIPSGDRGTRVMIVGNLLHEDSLLMRLKEDIADNRLEGITRSYPLLKNEQPIWPGKFKTQGDVVRLQKSVGSTASWHREYLLEIISDAERVVHPEWVQYYDDLLSDRYLLHTATGVDLAISQKQTADYTSMVSAYVYRVEGETRIFIMPNPVNERLTFPKTIERIKHVNGVLGQKKKLHYLYVESVGYQLSLIQQLKNDGIYAKAVQVNGMDKRSRLALTSDAIQSGVVLFPKQGAERLIAQLVGFGVEKHDDLADAFSILVLQVLTKPKSRSKVHFIGHGPRRFI